MGPAFALCAVRSLCRCSKWNAKGGKSGAYFAKTLDDRYVVKQLSAPEMRSFLEGGIGMAYLRYMTASLERGHPTCLAKILGLYQVRRSS
jgi:1-phosphatidylinositol-3-phosphate 5-kinase